ncbi:MAG: hypothetical protein H6838_05225 [Planctomycetes bacterium]|nr:hypothetical protein [Planctomycetota bacterium]MCB9884871.1 hypothetical protein [Planctomycetota bacterium]
MRTMPLAVCLTAALAAATPHLSAQDANDTRLAAAAAARAAYREVDYATLDRTIRKEPAYVAAPRYAMFVFDLAGKHRAWAVLDKSAADAPHYDVLYLDLDGDGDLTGKGERFVGKFDEKLVPAGMGLTIRVGDIRVPGTDLVHKKFLVSTTPKAGRKGFWFRMDWNGQQQMSGGYGALGMDLTEWAASAKEAPVLRPCPYGPLSFATWGDDEFVLRAGTSPKINVIVGNAGSGPHTLAVVDEHFLDLSAEELLVTVVAKDKNGNEVSETSRIHDHC